MSLRDDDKYVITEGVYRQNCVVRIADGAACFDVVALMCDRDDILLSCRECVFLRVKSHRNTEKSQEHGKKNRKDQCGAAAG